MEQSNLKIGDFVWAKMTGYPYWPGKIVEPDKDVKKPNKKFEMFFVRFYGTGDYAWTKADLIHKFNENREKYTSGSKRVIFVDAVKKCEHAVENREKGLPDT
uniref:PWWP domain-containing protein n=1 Tax=Ciona savignyi TaxID=51511 RepID=H2YMC7_CIOSA